VDERREDLLEGEGERDLAALGDNDRCTSEPGVEARELTLLKGSDLARMRLRLRAIASLVKVFEWARATLTSIRWAQGICLVLGLWRLEACLSRGRGEVNVDLWW
jgi:hypothetical protein